MACSKKHVGGLLALVALVLLSFIVPPSPPPPPPPPPPLVAVGVAFPPAELGSRVLRRSGVFSREAKEAVNERNMRKLIEEMEASTDAGTLFLYRDGTTNDGSLISRLDIGSSPHQRTVRRFLKTGGAFVVQFEHAPHLTHQLGMSRIDMISQAVGEALNTPVTSHLYVKGPGVSALPLHSDPTDTFVYQLAGCNRWRICTPHADQNSTETLSDSERAERLLIEHGGNPGFGGPWKGSSKVEDHTNCTYHTVTEGDTVYLPRGVLHAAEATACDRASPDEPVAGLMPGLSAHLTIGANRGRSEWVHLLDSVGTVLESSSGSGIYSKEDHAGIVEFARTLPPWRRQMPTWALREEGRLDEVLRQLRGKLELLRPYFKIAKREHGEASMSALSQSLQNPAVLHAAILVWQQQVGEYYETTLRIENREAPFRSYQSRRRLVCTTGDVCSAGTYGSVDAGNCDSSCFFFSCDASCDTCGTCTK